MNDETKEPPPRLTPPPKTEPVEAPLDDSELEAVSGGSSDHWSTWAKGFDPPEP